MGEMKNKYILKKNNKNKYILKKIIKIN